VKVGDSLSALMVVNPDGSRTIFAQMTEMGWLPFVFAERAALDRSIAKVRDSLDALRNVKGVKFEVCTFALSKRTPID